VKTFEELWSELSEKARTRPDGSGTVRAHLFRAIRKIRKELEEWRARTPQESEDE